MTSTKNKIVLVTGASRGLGKDMALQLAAKGFDVVITYHSQKETAITVVDEIKSLGRKAYALQLDVALSNTFEAFATNLKAVLKSEFNADGIDALVNNAGTGVHAPFTDTTPEQFDNMVDIHLKAPF